jgi:hypothetical protein
MYHYLIALRCEGQHELAAGFERMVAAVQRGRDLDAATRQSLLTHLEVLAREFVLPPRSRHRPALEASVIAVAAAAAGSERLSWFWVPLRRLVTDVTWTGPGYRSILRRAQAPGLRAAAAGRGRLGAAVRQGRLALRRRPEGAR